MEKSLKKTSWIIFFSMVSSIVGMIFGIVASCYIEDIVARSILIALIIVAALISVIVGLITFFAMRKGHVKNALVSVGKNSFFQGIGPLVCYILGMIGASRIGNQDQIAGFMVFLSITYILVLFTSGLNVKTLKGFRKDKENYTYSGVVSIIAAVALAIFCVAAMITMFKIPATGGTPIIGFYEVFALLFALSDILAVLGLAVLSFVAAKNAPKVTMADADAETLNKMASDISEIKSANTSAQPVDNVAKLREYKKLLDEGVITKEEFETKKKELL